MFRGFKKLLLGMAAGSLLAVGAAAQAQITVTLPDTTPIQSPGYSSGYDQYTFELQTNSTTHLASGNSITVDGIDGLFNALSPTNWKATDNQSLGDVTWTYTGSTTGTSQAISGFIVNTKPGFGGITLGEYSGVGTNGSGSSVSNSGSLQVPGPTGSSPGTSVPLPAAVYTFPLALVIAAFAYRRMRTHTVIA
jgi:hypothetical protein